MSEVVYLKPRFEDCPFAELIPKIVRDRWYKEWWAEHVGKPARIVYEFKSTIHLQFEGETVKYVVARSYLQGQ